jgi:hypothetical protein
MQREGLGAVGAILVPAVLAPVGIVAWMIGLAVALPLADASTGAGFAVGVAASAAPGACRILALLPHGRRMLLAGVVTVPLSAVAVGVTAVASVTWHFDFLSGPGPAVHELVWMTEGALAAGVPSAVVLAAAEVAAVGTVTEGSGAGAAAAAMVAGWLPATVLVIAGLAYGLGGADHHAWVLAIAIPLAIAVQALAAGLGGALSRWLARSPRDG